MAWPHNLRTPVSLTNPAEVGLCDACKFLYRLDALQYQYQWAGNALVNTHLLKCPRCLDLPSDQLRAIQIIGPEGTVRDPRPANYAADALGGTTPPTDAELAELFDDEIPAPLVYAGPGDIVAFTAWWGLRAYSSAVAASGTARAIRLTRASDGAARDIGILASGALDVATATTFLAGTTGTVTTLYDQTGNGWDLLTTAGGAFNFNALGSLPSISGVVVAPRTASNFAPASGTLTLSAVAKRAATEAAGVFILEIASTSLSLLFRPSTWQLRFGVPFLGVAAANGAWHAANGVIRGPLSTLMIDGKDSKIGTVTGLRTPGVILAFAKGTQATSYMEAGFIDNVGLPGSLLAQLNGNQRGYYGF